MSLDQNPFLIQKYPDLAGTKPVQSAVEKVNRENFGKKHEERKKILDNPDRVEAYMDRLESLVDNPRGFSKLKTLVLDRFTINTSSEETVDRIAEGLYESEKRIAIEQGRGGDIAKLEAQGEITKKYRPLIQEKAEIQRKTLSSWLDYLQENDAKQPAWFRYFVVRSLEKMGMLDKEKVTYSKRAALTVAPFPELNSEALGWVYKRLSDGVDLRDYQLDDEAKEDLTPEQQKEQQSVLDQKKQQVERLIQGKDFAKLYAYAQIETAGRLNRESVEGSWKKYTQNSDFRLLEKDLKGKGTGWCTAEGSARGQLESGDFYVFYSKGDGTKYTEPRVAIRMEGDKVAEVRGVNPKQEIEPELVDIAQKQYHGLPGGESYDKKASDMKRLTKLVQLQEKGGAFSSKDLRFLYELDSSIESFGYEKDPRIKALRDQRNPKEDAPILFECWPEEIAWKKEDITEKTRAYIGPLFPGVFKLASDLEHLYTSFPEGKITHYNVEIGGQTEKQLEEAIQRAGMKINDYALHMMRSKEFKTSKDPEKADLARLTVKDLFNDQQNHTTDEIYNRADQLGLELCPAEVGPHLRMKLKDQPMNEYFWIAMKQITDPDVGPHVFRVRRGDDGSGLENDFAGPTEPWFPLHEFVFRLRK